jgi:hypothetical protein
VKAGSILIPALQVRLIQVAKHLREAKLTDHARIVIEEDYVLAQRQIARRDYRDASGTLDRIEARLDGTSCQ